MKQRTTLLVNVVLALLALVISADHVFAASWNGIEPFKSRRADVERVLGKAISEGPDGTLRFTVAGGTAVVSFVDQRFVSGKKLRPDVLGTVLEITLQHEGSSDTPESMGLTKGHVFDREDVQNASFLRNLKDGVIYTFVDGKLRTTHFTFSADQLSHVRRGGR
jgi:hypothetical protein